MRIGAATYEETGVATSDPKRLVILCYEKTIERLKQAQRFYREGDYIKKAHALTAAHNIINELLASLDLEKGGQIAKNLDSLYNYMIRRIIEADINREIEGIEEITGMLCELKSAFEEAFFPKKPRVVGSLFKEDEPASSKTGVF